MRPGFAAGDLHRLRCDDVANDPFRLQAHSNNRWGSATPSPLIDPGVVSGVADWGECRRAGGCRFVFSASHSDRDALDDNDAGTQYSDRVCRHVELDSGVRRCSELDAGSSQLAVLGSNERLWRSLGHHGIAPVPVVHARVAVLVARTRLRQQRGWLRLEPPGRIDLRHRQWRIEVVKSDHAWNLADLRREWFVGRSHERCLQRRPSGLWSSSVPERVVPLPSWSDQARVNLFDTGGGRREVAGCGDSGRKLAHNGRRAGGWHRGIAQFAARDDQRRANVANTE
jgi:hypothetical protein